MKDKELRASISTRAFIPPACVQDFQHLKLRGESASSGMYTRIIALVILAVNQGLITLEDSHDYDLSDFPDASNNRTNLFVTPYQRSAFDTYQALYGYNNLGEVVRRVLSLARFICEGTNIRTPDELLSIIRNKAKKSLIPNTILLLELQDEIYPYLTRPRFMEYLLLLDKNGVIKLSRNRSASRAWSRIFAPGYKTKEASMVTLLDV